MTGNQNILPPGSTIGMIGSGQLGRMTALAGAAMGYHFAILGEGGTDSPAGEVSKYAWSWGKKQGCNVPKKTIQSFLKVVDVVTYEFENVPEELTQKIFAVAREMGKQIQCFPDPWVLAIAQDRFREKKFFRDAGLQTVEYLDETLFVPEMLNSVSWPCILKTSRNGYDGKGQIEVADVAYLPQALSELQADYPGVPLILEEKANLYFEISVIVARNLAGQIVYYPVVVNTHQEGILRITEFDSDQIGSVLETAAHAAAGKLAEKLGLVGVLAVEMFVMQDGSILINEIAPRPHNSGHWTIEGCNISQFAMHVRTVCGLDLSNPVPQCSDACMTNYIGTDPKDLLPRKHPNEYVHGYGKAEARPGRKMGHKTLILT